MKEEQDNLQPESIDQVIEGGELSASDRQTARLIQHLHTYTQEHARENERSLDRIWNHMAQSQKHPVFLPPEWKQPEERRIFIKERKVMEDTKISNRMSSPVERTQPKKRNSLFRVVGLSLVAAVALITILSFTLFSNILHPTPQIGSKGSSSVTGNQEPSTNPGAAQQQQINPKLACSFTDGEKISINGAPWGVSLTWSSQGQLAVATYSDVKMFSAKNCAPSGLAQSIQQGYEAQWSPNGKQLAMVAYGRQTVTILDRVGKIVANLSFSQLGTLGAGEMLWSSDSNTLIFASHDPQNQESIKSVDLNNGNKVTTRLILPSNSASIIFSPNGKFLLLEHMNMQAKRKDMEVWNINSGNKVSTIAVIDSPILLGWAFSPDGSQLALNGNIYNTATGALLTSFNTSLSQMETNLAWSPNGKYLALSTNTITIYDVNTWKAVATFDKIDAQHAITTLVWAPDSTGLASSTNQQSDDTPSENRVNVWKLN